MKWLLKWLLYVTSALMLICPIFFQMHKDYLFFEKNKNTMGIGAIGYGVGKIVSIAFIIILCIFFIVLLFKLKNANTGINLNKLRFFYKDWKTITIVIVSIIAIWNYSDLARYCYINWKYYGKPLNVAGIQGTLGVIGSFLYALLFCGL